MESTSFTLMRSGTLCLPGEVVDITKWQKHQLLGSEDVVQVAQGLPTMHGAPSLDLRPCSNQLWWHRSVVQSLGRLRPKDQKFMVNFSFTLSSRPAWATRDWQKGREWKRKKGWEEKSREGEEGREGQKERTIPSIPQSHSASSGPFRHATTSLCCNSVLLKLKISFDLCDLQNP